MKLITLYPTGSARILGDPVVGTPPEVVTEAPRDLAECLLAYQPPAFSRQPTPFSESLGDHPVNVLAPPPAAAGADGPSEAPDAGSPEGPATNPAAEPEG